MADPEHYRILVGKVRPWNKWRNENPNIRPDLSGSDLTMVNLHRRNLRGVNLREANLKRIDLLGADLRGTDLSGAILIEANLERSRLSDANLSGANLAKADLSKSDLSGVNLTGANLNWAVVAHANLTGATLQRANLSESDFWEANLENAILIDVNLNYCCLVQSNLTGATLTGAMLWGTARDDWEIKRVKCKYVFWDEDGKQRSPKDRDLEPGEFERIYAALPTIEYIFENGMSPLDPLIMDRVVQAIREKKPEFDIKVDSINARGLAPSIKFTVQHEDHKEPALEEVREEYELKVRLLEAERDRYYQLVARAIDTPKEVKLITAGPGAIVATDGSTINIQAHIHNALELQKAIAKEPEGSKSFAKVAKKTALDIIGGVIKDIAKGQVKEAGKQIIELAKDLGPIIAKTAAYAFFKSML